MAAFAAYPNLRKVIRRYPLASGASFLEGALVVADEGEVDECGADPDTILGVALHDAGADPDTAEVLVALATPETTFVMQGTSDPVAGDENVEYGVAKDGDGIWVVDKTDEVNVAVYVERVHLDRLEFEVRVLAANRQISG